MDVLADLLHMRLLTINELMRRDKDGSRARGPVPLYPGCSRTEGLLLRPEETEVKTANDTVVVRSSTR